MNFLAAAFSLVGSSAAMTLANKRLLSFRILSFPFPSDSSSLVLVQTRARTTFGSSFELDRVSAPASASIVKSSNEILATYYGNDDSDAFSCPTFMASNMMPTLPVLRSPGFNKSWDSYLGRIYGGPVPREDYPINLNLFEWFYAFAPIDVKPLVVSNHCRVPFGGSWRRRVPKPEVLLAQHGREEGPEQLLAQRGFFVQRYREGASARSMGTVGRTEWIEVIHVAVKRIGGAKGADGKPYGQIGSWYFRTRGSGVFLNTGDSTLVVNGSAKPPWQFRLPAYQADGIQTIQAPISVDNFKPMENNRFEIVDLRNNGEMESCPGVYRTGFSAEKECHCDESLGFTNCVALHDMPTPVKTAMSLAEHTMFGS